MIAPSILSADFARLADELASVPTSDWIHVDVMDNHFVPNLTLGLPVVKSLLKVTDIPIDCHLMIDDPDRWAIGYAEAGAYNVTVHVEAANDPVKLAKDLKAAGSKAGLSIKPGTPLEPYVDVLKHYDTLLVMSVEPGFGGQSFMTDVLDKVRQARHLVDTGHLKLLVEIDGGINADTIEQAAQAGVDCFVAGSAVYDAADPGKAVEALRAQAARAQAAGHRGERAGAGHHQPQPAGRLRHPRRTRQGGRLRRHPARRWPARRGHGAQGRRSEGPRRHRDRHPRTVLALRAHAAVHRSAARSGHQEGHPRRQRPEPQGGGRCGTAQSGRHRG
jgi:ribulose-phosphate 3-epimerase